MSTKEQTIIGLILLDPNQYHLIANKVDESVYASDLHKSIWRAFKTLTGNSTPINYNNVLGLIPDTSLEYLLECSSLATFQNDIESALEELNDDAIKRQLDLTAKQIQYNYRDKSGKETLNYVNQVTNDINLIAVSKNTTEHVSSFLTEVMEDLSKGQIYGIKTNYRVLDDYLYGLKNGSMYIIGARPSHGKTALGLQIAWNVVQQDVKTLFISLEMTSNDLIKRVIAKEAKVNLSYLVQNKCPETKHGDVGQAIAKINDTPLRIYQNSQLYIEDLKSILIIEKKKYGLDCVFIDYIQLIRSRDRSLSRVEEIEKVSRELKSIAMELDIPLVSLAQLNRQSEMRGNSKPKVSDLKGSGAIEQDADVVLLLDREDIDKKGTEKETQYCSILIAKNRHGATAKIATQFIGEYTYFDLR